MNSVMAGISVPPRCHHSRPMPALAINDAALARADGAYPSITSQAWRAGRSHR